jgi:hypothetical protein
MEQSKLNQYFKFDEADLQANRAGQLTERQKVRISANENFHKKWSLIGGLLALGIAAIGLLGALRAWMLHSDPTFSIVFGGIWTIIWGVIAVRLLMSVLKKRTITPAKIEGQARVVEAKSYSANTHRNTIHHELHIGGKRFMATTFLAEIIKGEPCIIYYVDHSIEHPYDTSYLHSADDILSVEAI